MGSHEDSIEVPPWPAYAVFLGGQALMMGCMASQLEAELGVDLCKPLMFGVTITIPMNLWRDLVVPHLMGPYRLANDFFTPLENRYMQSGVDIGYYAALYYASYRLCQNLYGV